MKRCLLFLLLVGVYSSVYLQTSTINGHVSFSRDSFNMANIRLIEKGVTKMGVIADSLGNFSIKEVPYGIYDLETICGVSTHDSTNNLFDSYSIMILPSAKIKNLKVDSVSPSFLEIHYPGICEYDNESNRKGICPEGHKDNIIPIVYGYATTKTLTESKKGEFIVGGCLVSNCDPHWYCKRHDLRF